MRFLRALLLAPVGGERRLLEAATATVEESGSSPRLYSAPPPVSTEPGRRAASLVFEPGGAARERKLADLAAALAPGASLVVLDHNAPRTPGMRLVARAHLALARPWLGEPVRQRLRRSVARELDALGLDVVRLRLLRGELFQAVLVRKP